MRTQKFLDLYVPLFEEVQIRTIVVQESTVPPEKHSELLRRLAAALPSAPGIGLKASILEFSLAEQARIQQEGAASYFQKGMANLPEKYKEAGTELIIKASKKWQKAADKWERLLLPSIATYTGDETTPSALQVICLGRPDGRVGVRNDGKKISTWFCCNSGVKKPPHHVVKKEQQVLGKRVHSDSESDACK